jgi:predicted DNA-binding transcriptional regulator YafY
MAILADKGLRGNPLQHKRHAEILERLENYEELSIGELAREWGVDPKTIQRDFDKLKQMYPGKLERSEDKKKYRKPMTHRAQNDGDMVLEILESMVRDIGVDFYKKAHPLLERLQRQIKTPFYTRLDVEDIGGKFDIVLSLEKAIEKKREVSLSYTPYGDKNPKQYTSVRPIKVIVYEGFWYLLAQHNDQTKKFYLKSIQTCELTNAIFKHDPKVLERLENSINVWFSTDKEPYEVRLWVGPNVVTYFERKPISRNQKLYKQRDGSAELVLKVTDDEEIYPLLKYWIPHLRVIEPIRIQEHYENLMRGYLDNPL